MERKERKRDGMKMGGRGGCRKEGMEKGERGGGGGVKGSPEVRPEMT